MYNSSTLGDRKKTMPVIPEYSPEQPILKDSTYPEVALPTNQKVEYDRKMIDEIILIVVIIDAKNVIHMAMIMTLMMTMMVMTPFNSKHNKKILNMQYQFLYMLDLKSPR
jgi:hypothetical protein